ncbi:hypothetical protein [Crossiella sp. S99.1]|uniref:hypothetical protein n=1 Tax=Crossiella sp. S99.1 TaxID=2936271 RepID=UPI0020003185|nr:hypothetical protein [Crossiella sp. S99.1]MCK2258300.1 hypothetical protein [Crossiella sp. S99.1]
MLTLIPLDEYQAKLEHLAELAEALPEFSERPGGTWLYRQILSEVDVLSIIAWEYYIEAVKARIAMQTRYEFYGLDMPTDIPDGDGSESGRGGGDDV